MKIVFDPALTKQNEDDQTVFFTLADDNGNQYAWHCDMPKTQQITRYLLDNIDKFIWLIRRREYPDLFPIADDVTLIEFDKYVFANNIAAKPFKSTHPKQSKLEQRLIALEERINKMNEEMHNETRANNPTP